MVADSEVLKSPGIIPASHNDPGLLQYVPLIRSGSFADVGHRRSMEDEHICIDDLSTHLDSSMCCPTPTAFYGVFDGHGGPDAATYLKKHAIRFLIEEANFPRASEADELFVEEVQCSVKKALLLVDHSLADDSMINSSSGTTVLLALVLGRILLVANVGDSRAVLCRSGNAVEMSLDHRPIRMSERERVEKAGGYIEGGYVNGVLSVTRALGDWDLKCPHGSSPLIAEPEFKQVLLTKDDEFLIIGCDGIWDVMPNQHAINVVRRGLRRHDDPERCARELALEALRLNAIDNLTIIVVCFSAEPKESSPAALQRQQPLQKQKLRCCSLSAEALCNLQTWLNDSGSS